MHCDAVDRSGNGRIGVRHRLDPDRRRGDG